MPDTDVKPSAFATLLVRFAGCVLILSAIPTAAIFILSGFAADGFGVIGGPDGPTSIFLTREIDWLALLVSTALPAVFGVVLILASHPLGRMMSKGLESEK